MLRFALRLSLANEDFTFENAVVTESTTRARPLRFRRCFVVGWLVRAFRIVGFHSSPLGLDCVRFVTRENVCEHVERNPFFYSGKTARRFVGHKKDVLSVAISADNRQIVSGSRDHNIKLWNTIAQCKYSIDQNDPDSHDDWISCVRFSPNPLSPIIVSCGWDKLVKARNSLLQSDVGQRRFWLFANCAAYLFFLFLFFLGLEFAELQTEGQSHRALELPQHRHCLAGRFAVRFRWQSTSLIECFFRRREITANRCTTGWLRNALGPKRRQTSAHARGRRHHQRALLQPESILALCSGWPLRENLGMLSAKIANGVSPRSG